METQRENNEMRKSKKNPFESDRRMGMDREKIKRIHHELSKHLTRVQQLFKAYLHEINTNKIFFIQ